MRADFLPLYWIQILLALITCISSMLVQTRERLAR